MGQMPLLEVDGQVVHQSLAIVRYLAKRFNVAGDNDWEALLIETAGDTISDFRISKVFCDMNPTQIIIIAKCSTI